MSGRKPAKGDKVRVIYEAVFDQHRGCGYWLRDETDGTASSIPASATVEVIEPAEDPSKDPVGTVRKGPGGTVVAKNLDGDACSWEAFVSDNIGRYFGDEGVRDWEIIGAVPGTPAVEKPNVPRHVVAEAAELLLAGKKIQAIKAVRMGATWLDLKAAKVFVESLPEHATWARSPIPYAPGGVLP